MKKAIYAGSFAPIANGYRIEPLEEVRYRNGWNSRTLIGHGNFHPAQRAQSTVDESSRLSISSKRCFETIAIHLCFTVGSFGLGQVSFQNNDRSVSHCYTQTDRTSTLTFRL